MLNITNIPAPRVPVIDPATNLMSREWYRFFFNIFTLTGSGSDTQSLQDVQLGPQTDSSALAAIEQQIQSLTTYSYDASSQDKVIMDALQSLAIQPSNTPHLHRVAYGSFYDLTDQTAAAINTAYAMTFGHTDLSNGVYIGSPSSRVYVDRPGVYNIQFSAQLDKTSATAKNIWIWLDKNGSTVSNTATQITLQGANTATVAAWNFLLEMNANDYFRLMWATDDTSCYIKHDAAAAPVPAIPSIILTVSDNISSYSTGA